jgi:hypothetical protein
MLIRQLLFNLFIICLTNMGRASDTGLFPNADNAAIDLFQKATDAAASGTINKELIVGLEMAKKLVSARKASTSPLSTPPELTELFDILVSNFPEFSKEIQDLERPLNWNNYQDAVKRFVTWKNPKDNVILWGYNRGYRSSNSIEFPQMVIPKDWIPFGFIPTPKGVLGELTILFCLIHKVAVCGIPLDFTEITIDGGINSDTACFIRHDIGHNVMAFGLQKNSKYELLKRSWLCSGRAFKLLSEIDFNREIIYLLSQLVWENDANGFCIDFPAFYYQKYGKTFERKVLQIYHFLYEYFTEEKNPFGDNEELSNNIFSFRATNPNWFVMKNVFKHVRNLQHLTDIMDNMVEPPTILINYMKNWGIFNLEYSNGTLDIIDFLETKGLNFCAYIQNKIDKNEISLLPANSAYGVFSKIEKLSLSEPK